MTSISVKIKHSLEILTRLHDISEADICRKTNISQATLNRLLTGTTDDPRASTLNEIAAFFNVTLDQLLGNQPIVENQTSAQIGQCSYLPIMEWDDIKNINNIMKKISPSTWKRWIEVESAISKDCFAINVVGESMWPQFMEGTILIVDPTIKPRNRDFVIAYLAKDSLSVFRQYIEESNKKILKPINYAFDSAALSKDDKIVGVVRQTRNSLRN